MAKVLEGYGFRIVEADAARRTIVLEGSAGAAAAAFGVDLARYEYTGGSYRGREGHVEVPAEIADLAEGVFGLDDRPQARAHFRLAAEATPAAAVPLVAKSLTALDVARAYDFPAGTGVRAAIGIVELGGGYLDTDNQADFAGLGLGLPIVVAVDVDGATNNPSRSTRRPRARPDWEVGLDVQVAGAVAPGARIAVYFAPNSSAGFLDAITTAIDDATNAPP